MSHKYGFETLSCLGPKMWEIIPCHIRNRIGLKVGSLTIVPADFARCTNHNWVFYDFFVISHVYIAFNYLSRQCICIYICLNYD